MEFTIEEEKAAGVTGKKKKKKYPAAMLRARCIAALARVVFPDLLLGVYESDELAPASNNMPSVSVQATVTVLPLSALPAAEEDQPVEMRSGVVADWSDRLRSAEDIDELEVIRASCKQVVTDQAQLLELGAVYAARKRELQAPQAVAQ